MEVDNTNFIECLHLILLLDPQVKPCGQYTHHFMDRIITQITYD